MIKNLRYVLALTVIFTLASAFISKKNPKPSISPIEVELLTKSGSGFGMRTHPITHEKKMHTGMDFQAPLGTPVRATADGKIIKVTFSDKNYGNRITIQHDNNITSSYAHLQNIHVKEGALVSQKDQIGTVGNTGASLNPHLHYEVKIEENHVDPSMFIKN